MICHSQVGYILEVGHSVELCFKTRLNCPKENFDHYGPKIPPYDKNVVFISSCPNHFQTSSSGHS